jgi:hypothetical protein
VVRRPITSPWTPELDERLTLLAKQGASAIRAAGALNKPISAVRIRARKLGLKLPGVRELKKKIRLLDQQAADLETTP